MNTNLFTKSYNLTHATLPLIHRLRAKAEYMYLTPVVKAQLSIVTITVECDTSHELRILKKMAGG